MARNQTVLCLDKFRLQISGPCYITGKMHSVIVPRDGYNAWQRGAFIQDALRDVSPETREFLISGVSPEGWNQLYPDKEEE